MRLDQNLFGEYINSFGLDSFSHYYILVLALF